MGVVISKGEMPSSNGVAGVPITVSERKIEVNRRGEFGRTTVGTFPEVVDLVTLLPVAPVARENTETNA